TSGRTRTLHRLGGLPLERLLWRAPSPFWTLGFGADNAQLPLSSRVTRRARHRPARRRHANKHSGPRRLWLGALPGNLYGANTARSHAEQPGVVCRRPDPV